MKKTLVAIILTTGIAVATASQIIKKPKDTPEVIVETTGAKPKVYTTGFTFNFTAEEIKKINKDLYEEDTANSSEYATIYVHCRKCGIGVYSEHENEKTPKCTYCSALESE
jgi:hypothetical protein